MMVQSQFVFDEIQATNINSYMDRGNSRAVTLHKLVDVIMKILGAMVT